MTPTTFTVYSDPGHGWIAVKRDYLTTLGIMGDITAFSYQRGGTVYLEEDGDAGLFVTAYKNATGENPVWNQKHTDKRSSIRSYECFNADVDPRDVTRAFKGLSVGDTVTLSPTYGGMTCLVEQVDGKTLVRTGGRLYQLKAGHMSPASILDRIKDVKGLSPELAAKVQ